MYDVQLALTDMARQLKACRVRDGLTLQQLATRCGVAASTIHKIEAQQMVPTVSVLLKVARGLGRRPEELVRDRYRDIGEPAEAPRATGDGAGAAETEPYFDRGVGAWRIDCARGDRLDLIPLVAGQRAILIVERGRGELSNHHLETSLEAGQCLELEGDQVFLTSDVADPIAALLIVSPAGRLAEHFGPPNAAPRPPARHAASAIPAGSRVGSARPA